MKTREDVANRIQQLYAEKNITVNGLATLAAVSPSTVKNIIYGVSKTPEL